MADLVKDIFEDAEDALPEEFSHMAAEGINQRVRLLENELRVLKEENTRLNLDHGGLKDKIKENKEKIKLNNQLPYLVGNIVEVLDLTPEDEDEEDGAAADADSQRTGKAVVLKTSTRQTIFLPVVGLVDAATLKPGDLVGVNKDSYLILDTLPAEYDSRVKAMEVDEKPTEDYSDVGGLDKLDIEKGGDREVQRTMLELLNQDARAKILRIHSRKMNASADVNFEELARSSDDFNAAQLKAVCVEAGMLALRRDGTEVNHEDFVEGITQARALPVAPALARRTPVPQSGLHAKLAPQAALPEKAAISQGRHRLPPAQKWESGRANWLSGSCREAAISGKGEEHWGGLVEGE
eukprot:gene3177-13190_t